MTGLSIATVSHALNGTRAVSEDSKERVVAAAKAVGYRPNLAARMLRTQKSNTIAIIIPSDTNNINANYFYMDVIMGVRRKMNESQHELIVSTYDPYASGGKSSHIAQVLQKQWVDGVILVPSAGSQKRIKLIQDMNLPYVLLDRRGADDSSCVTSDNQKGAADAVRLMASCGKKCIGFIGGVGSTTSRLRFAGYTQAMEELGLPMEESRIFLCPAFSLEVGERGAEQLLAASADAIFVADNVMMMGALRHLKAMNVAVPEEVGIVGFDDFDWMDMLSPPITTIKQQAYQMGYVAAELLLRKLGGMDSNEVIVLDTSLVIRQSHGIPLEGTENR